MFRSPSSPSGATAGGELDEIVVGAFYTGALLFSICVTSTCLGGCGPINSLEVGGLTPRAFCAASI